MWSVKVSANDHRLVNRPSLPFVDLSESWAHALILIKMFDDVVIVAFQIIFCSEIHVNDIFLFFKNYFWYQHIKTIQNLQNILNFNKKKLIFLETRFALNIFFNYNKILTLFTWNYAVKYQLIATQSILVSVFIPG